MNKNIPTLLGKIIVGFPGLWCWEMASLRNEVKCMFGTDVGVGGKEQ